MYNVGTGFNQTETPESNSLRIRAADASVVFNTSFTADTWHNFAVLVDWDALTLQAFYSADAAPLAPVSDVVENTNAKAGADGQGDFHFGLLKVNTLIISAQKGLTYLCVASVDQPGRLSCKPR